jgi:Gluconate 2-dehydrogenase subunit 3
MNKQWTRRELMETGLIGAVVVGGHAVKLLGTPLVRLQPEEEKRTGPALSSNLCKILRAAADEIIPESEGMPAASSVGTLEYLSGVFSKSRMIAREFQSGLAALEAITKKRFKVVFFRLSRADRVKALSEFERREPAFFATLRDFVYEGYYLQPQIWKMIGYEFYPLQKPVPEMKPFDEKALEKVRNRARLYREVQ